MLGIFKTITLYLAAGVEAAAAVVIGIAAIEATARALLIFFRGDRMGGRSGADTMTDEKENVRLRLGRWLAVALEFELAADILRTAISPTWKEIGQLAAIAVLRTALNFFLQQEIDKAAARQRAETTAANSVPTDTPLPVADRADR